MLPSTVCELITAQNIEEMDFDIVPIDDFWNIGDEKEQLMHRIHTYPAKFPSFITTKALAFAKEQSFKASNYCGYFCGCGTVAFEAKRNKIIFGVDINPVATMIDLSKSRKYRL